MKPWPKGDNKTNSKIIFMNESQPLNIDPLAQREQGLKERIGKKEALIEKIQSQGGLTPATVAERIRHQRELLVASYIKGTLELELQPRLTEITTQLDSAAKKLAESYEEEKAQAALEFAKLERTAKNTSRRTQIPYEDLVAEARQEITQLEERPLTDSLLQRGINLLKKEPETSQSAPEEASREEVKKVEEPEEEEKQRADGDKSKTPVPGKKELSNKKVYIIILPDGRRIETNFKNAANLIAANLLRPLTSNEQLTAVYGTLEEIKFPNQLVGKIRKEAQDILEQNGMKMIQPNPSDSHHGIQRPFVIVSQDFQIPNISVNLDNNQIRLDGKILNFEANNTRSSAKALLIHLARNAAFAISTEDLLKVAKENGFSGDKTAKLISSLRRLLGDNLNQPQIISIYGNRNSYSYGLNARVAVTEKVNPKQEITHKDTEGLDEPKVVRTIKQGLFLNQPTNPDRVRALIAMLMEPNIAKTEIIKLIGTNKEGRPIANLARVRRSLLSVATLLASKNYSDTYSPIATPEEKQIWNSIKEIVNIASDREARRELAKRIDEWFKDQKGEAHPANAETYVLLEEQFKKLTQARLSAAGLVRDGFLQESDLFEIDKELLSVEKKLAEQDFKRGLINPTN